MTNVLFCSEDYIKSNSSLSDNMFGKNLLPALRESQDLYLQQIIGSSLYNKLIELVDENTIGDDEYALYKDLLDNYVRPYLLYKTLVQLLPVINAKIVNFGSSQSSDEHLVNLSQGDVVVLEGHFETSADFYARRLQEYILNNCNSLGVDACTCEGIRSNLNNAATTGIFLGGIRGRKIVPGPTSYRR